jgi:hypothetical protein
MGYVLLATNILAADDPKNIAGYGKTKWDMMPDDVINAESPRAEKLEQPLKFYTGIGLVTIKEIEIGVQKFGVIFLFDESKKKLYQVNLTSFELKNSEINARSFSSIEKLLTEKYGIPTFKEEGHIISWKLPITTIELNHLKLFNRSQVTIIYKSTVTSGKAASDL